MPSTESPVYVGPYPTKNPFKPLYDPTVPTLPKNWKPISMQDDQTTNLKLAHRRSDTSCSQNHSISSEFSRPVTIAAGTNEVAMWALQLYIGLLPNFHSPFRESMASIFQTVFSHGISIPPPTSRLSLGHFPSRAPRVPFFHTMVRYTCALSHLSNTCSYLCFSSDIVHFGYLAVLCVGT
jgi:hypothetical protein